MIIKIGGEAKYEEMVLVDERNGDKIISLKSDSPFKEVQNMYESGFTYKQIVSIAQFLVAISNGHFTNIDDVEEVL